MTSAPSQLQQQLHDELLPMYGRPAADSAVLDCLTRHGFKLPKTLHKSARGDGKIWLTHKKADVELLLATQPYNPLFPPLPAERKGMWMPRLTCAVFSGQHIALPAGLDWNTSAAEAGQRLGTPWWPRNDLGHRVWRVPHLGAAHVNTQWSVDLGAAGLLAPQVGIDVNEPALHLGLFGGPMFDLEEVARNAPLFWLTTWLWRQLGHVPLCATAADGVMAMTQAVTALGRTYLLREDFGRFAPFHWAYGHSTHATTSHGLREDVRRIVDWGELPTDAQLAELHHTFAQRLTEFEASNWA